MDVSQRLQIETEYIPLIEKICWPGEQDALADSRVSRALVDFTLLVEEALLANGAKEAYHNFADLVLLKTNDLIHATSPVEINDLRDEDLSDGYIEAHREFITVIAITWETESIIEQEELVRPISIAVVDLLTCLEIATIFIHEVEVGVIRVLFGVEPAELLL